MKTWKPYAVVLSALLAAACASNQKEPDGPVENAGEEVDEAADDAGDKVEDAGDKVEDAADDAN